MSDTSAMPVGRPASIVLGAFGGLLLVFSLALAGIAQAILVYLPDALEIPSGMAGALQPIWPHPAQVVYAIGLFLVAILLFATALRLTLQDAPISPQEMCPPVLVRPLWPAILLAGTGVLLLGWVLIRLAATDYDPADPRWYALSLLLIFAALLWNERSRLAHISLLRNRLRGSLICEVAYVVLVTGVFIWLSTWDLGSWYYSALGDEHAFFYLARDFAQGQTIRNLFTQHGVYDIIPMLSAYVEGKLMVVLGNTGIGWKESIILQVAAALVLFYLLARSFYGNLVAVLATGMLATAHYLLAYVHTGYANVETLLPTVASLLFFVQGVRQRSWLLLALSGAFAALGWYTYYPSRVTVFIVGACIVLSVRRDSWLRTGLVVAAGFAAVLLPLLVVNSGDLVSSMLSQTGSGNTTEYAANRAMLPLWNAGRSLMAFNYNEHNGPYLYGSLAEPVTAMLFALGLGYGVATWRDTRSRMLLSWFVLAVIASGILSKYDYVSVSRLNFLLPVVTLFAALACERAMCALRMWLPAPRRGVATWVAVALVLGLTTFGNLHRWFVEAPANLPSTADALAIRIIAKPICMSGALPLFVGDTLGGEILPALDARGIPNHVAFAAYNDPPTWISSMSSRCVIFRSRYDPRTQTVMQAVARRRPTARPVLEYDRSGQFAIIVYYPPS